MVTRLGWRRGTGIRDSHPARPAGLAAAGLKFTVTGVENLPVTGGAVMAINHTSYFDFTFAGLPDLPAAPAAARCVSWRRRRSSTTRSPGRSCAACATSRWIATAAAGLVRGRLSTTLKAGELVGVYPEATISRSFEIKDFKSGAARMAIAADVPIVPHIVWGAQRIWTKGHPKNLYRPEGADLDRGGRADPCRRCPQPN